VPGRPEQFPGAGLLNIPFIGDATYPSDIPAIWNPEAFFNTMVVNGVSWPSLEVEPDLYRFRLLNGCNSRFLNLFFDNDMSFVVIGSDGGYLQSPVRESSLTVLPGSRMDILVDFSNVRAGTEIIMRNNANAPYPDGDPADPDTVGQIIKFTVGDKPGFMPKKLPAQLNPTLQGAEWPALQPGGFKRILTLNEQSDRTGRPLGLFLNGQMWDAPVSETPKNGTTEDWYFVNLTGDAQPMHLHLVQFNIVSRQDFNADEYLADWLKLNEGGLINGMLPFKMDWQTKVLPFEPYLTPGTRTFADPDERGWRDLVCAGPGPVTRIRAPCKKQNGQPYEFDPTAGPGYVWHCHIVGREDNEMRRPLVIKK
jgi:FtsP/CotA-like multicopper oxidase with cupredoxin domain